VTSISNFIVGIYGPGFFDPWRTRRAGTAHFVAPDYRCRNSVLYYLFLDWEPIYRSALPRDIPA
jgi:hypothetical protein